MAANVPQPRRPNWSPQQDRALHAIRRWLANGSASVFRLFGFAGTGKTELALEVGSWVHKAHFAAYTGKAASVLQQRGGVETSTLHRLCYHSAYDPDRKTFLHTPKPCDPSIDLLIVDEGSMVNRKLGEDILRLRIPTLVCIDPFQLPPPDGEAFFMGSRPDASLTEIHRQARDHPIIALADRIRRGKLLQLRTRDAIGEAVRIVQKDYGFSPEEFDAVLCGLNKTRHWLNRVIRRELGFSGPIPEVGEIVVCQRNDYSVVDPCFNGSTWAVTRSGLEEERRWRNAFQEDAEEVSEWLVQLRLRAVQDRNSRTNVHVPLACFSENPPQVVERGHQDFSFGFALTVHKAQGSEWPRVLLFDEYRCFRQDEARWLYTAVTRAKESLMIVLQR
jgi:ATP-dependent exoDNAse (exonuclease V) alpha subunit